MTATEELRRLLDEHGIEYDADDTTLDDDDVSQVTYWQSNDIEWSADGRDEYLAFDAVQLITPEQAIAATLGAGTCQQEEGGWSTEGDHARVWLTCGHDCMVETVADLPNFCPVCGAKVVSE